MRGSAEVERRVQKTEALFALIEEQSLPAELTSHYARYLCVLVAGFAEQSVKELVSEHARTKSSPRIHRYVQGQLKLVWGLDDTKLQRLVEALDPTWWELLSEGQQEELAALESVAAIRNVIAHGGDAGITLVTIRRYFDDLKKLFRALAEILGDE
ncbi:HEPN domain-containing protein [Glutamicibacter sp. NPDC087583]|uniref:HEPN domain-containing protein n=1 Tax=Glutamicibacter sp. NPDC087583 TaxID=3363995 RepID=UPI0037F86F9E